MKRAFTIIELLVVIAFIAALFALILPAVLSSRESARKLQCANNMRQMAIGIHNLAKPRNDVIDQQRVHEELRLRQIRVCPNDPQRELRIRDDLTGYLYNIAAHNSNEVIARSKTISHFEAATDYFIEQVNPTDWFQSARINQRPVWDALILEIAPHRHSGSMANYLYLDGHVQSISEAAIKQWTEQGFNFALSNNGQPQ